MIATAANPWMALEVSRERGSIGHLDPGEEDKDQCDKYQDDGKFKSGDTLKDRGAPCTGVGRYCRRQRHHDHEDGEEKGYGSSCSHGTPPYMDF